MVSSPPSPVTNLPIPPLDVTEFIPGPELHITESFLNAHFGDDKSIRVRGEIRSIEVTILSKLMPRFDFKEVLDIIKMFREIVQSKVDQSSNGRMEESQVLVPHATSRNKNDSYKTVPLKVAQACAEAMKRNGCSLPQTSSPSRKRRKK